MLTLSAIIKPNFLKSAFELLLIPLHLGWNLAVVVIEKLLTLLF